MFVYTFSKLAKLGEMDEKYGQSYWGETNQALKPVKFNSMNQEITAEDTIEAEERAEKRSGKGIDYYQLKKVKVVSMDARVQQAVSTQLADAGKPTQLDRIEAKLDTILSYVGPSQPDPLDAPIYDTGEDL